MLVNLFPRRMGGEDPLAAGFSPLLAHADDGTGTACGKEGSGAAVGVAGAARKETASPRSEAGPSSSQHSSGRRVSHSFLEGSSAAQ